VLRHLAQQHVPQFRDELLACRAVDEATRPRRLCPQVDVPVGAVGARVRVDGGGVVAESRTSVVVASPLLCVPSLVSWRVVCVRALRGPRPTGPRPTGPRPTGPRPTGRRPIGPIGARRGVRRSAAHFGWLLLFMFPPEAKVFWVRGRVMHSVVPSAPEKNSSFAWTRTKGICFTVVRRVRFAFESARHFRLWTVREACLLCALVFAYFHRCPPAKRKKMRPGEGVAELLPTFSRTDRCAARTIGPGVLPFWIGYNGPWLNERHWGLQVRGR
jgi:hypothetical protein